MKVLLVDDHNLVRKGIAHLLEAVIDDPHISEAENADQAIRAMTTERPDVALVDIRMPGRDGLDLLREVRATWPEVPVIMLTCFDESEYVKRALADGAAGYLLKDSTPEDLLQAIKVAISGSGNVLSPRAVRNLFDTAAQASERASVRSTGAEAGLTRREIDILSNLAEGSSNREISKALFLSEKTVKAHLAAIFRKLGVTNRTKAAMAAVAMGLGSHAEGGTGPLSNGQAYEPNRQAGSPRIARFGS